MRTFRIIGTVLMTVLMCANFTSCNNDDDEFYEENENNIPNNTIRYQTTNGIIVRFKNDDVFGGAKMIDNTYSTTNGYGRITFATEVTAIEEGAFKSQKKLSSITLPNSVVTIGKEAFYYCDNLTNIKISKNATSIGNGAFRGCSGLTSIVIPNSVTSIGNGAFGGCSGLTSIVITNSVTSIGSYAFYGCTNLKNIYLKSNTPIEFDDIADLYWCFNDYTCEEAILYVPQGSLTAYQTAIGWKRFKNIQEYQVD